MAGSAPSSPTPRGGAWWPVGIRRRQGCARMKMTTEEAFVKVLQMHGIEHAFGIIGSAFMQITELFPKAGITFWGVEKETKDGLIGDGYNGSDGKTAKGITRKGQ